ncbi:MAG: PIG-L family deacetylase [Candidatus Dormibacteria bacterium]
MFRSELTMMLVHAHPDDEVLSTGGVIHRYAREGIRIVLVTCTGGELGDGPGGVKPDQPGHDQKLVREVRRGELEASCKVLGIDHLELLGYLDSGMSGWPQNERAGSLTGTPLLEELPKLLALMDQYQPQVVVTYDERGGYGHPDHIRAHQLAREATIQSAIQSQLFYAAMPKSLIRTALAAARAAGVELADLPQIEFDPDDPPFGVEDHLITTTVDVSGEVPAKLEALRCHASQLDNAFLLNLPEAAAASFLGTEHFILALGHPGSATPERDLFAGLR